MSTSDDEGMRRTTIRLNTELERRAKALARERNQTFTSIVSDALSRYVAAPPPPRNRRKKSIVLPVVGDPKRRITQAQYNAIIEEMYREEAEQMVRGDR